MNEQNSKPDLELVRRLKDALNASSEGLYQHILDPHPEVVAAAIKNRRLSEDHLLALLKRRDLTEMLVDRVYRQCNKTISHRLVLALVKNPATSGTIIRSLLPRLHLFELVDLCLMPGASPDQRLAAERQILQRLPTTPLGNKITLARRATASVVAELLKEGNPALTEVCLNNPRLNEGAIYQFLIGPQSAAETISLIARHNRWKQRPNLRLAILKHPRTPEIWYTLWLPKLSAPLLRQLRSGQRLNARQKQLVKTELNRRGMT